MIRWTFSVCILVLIISACTPKTTRVSEPVHHVYRTTQSTVPITKPVDPVSRPRYQERPDYHYEQNNSRNDSVGQVEVRPGDTVYSISRAYGLHPTEVIEINSLKPPYTIYPGQKLLIPGRYYRNSDQPNPYTENKLKDKKYISGSKDSTVSVEEMPRVVSRNEEDLKLVSSRPVALSDTSSTKNAKQYYVVQKGDTLYSISKAKGYDFKEIIRVNKLMEPFSISPGDVLILPD